jgi:hypothetical protein
MEAIVLCDPFARLRCPQQLAIIAMIRAQDPGGSAARRPRLQPKLNAEGIVGVRPGPCPKQAGGRELRR